MASARKTVMIVDADETAREHLTRALRRDHHVLRAGSAEAALGLIGKDGVDVVLANRTLPGIGGDDFLRIVRENYPMAEFVMLADEPDVDAAVAAVKLGAYHFLVKTAPAESIASIVAHAAERQDLNRKVLALADEVKGQSGDHEFVSGPSTAIRKVLEDVHKVAKHSATVLIRGESGTGKELVARMIHRRSEVADGPFIAVNLAAIPRELVESTLFGHEKGAFTGADRAQRGLFEQAHEGTLFLDEVGELPPAAQVALLRVLETRTFRRVGGDRDVACDVRVVAATHRDLRAMAATGAFRGDLLYRLDGYSVVLPPLRERAEDVPELVRRFVDDANVRHGRAVRGLTPLALEVLQAYPFPGNVRELKNLVERAVVMARGELADAGDLPEHVRAPAATAAGPAPADGDLRERVKRYEAELIRAALGAAGGSRAKAAEALGLPLRTLAHKIKEHGIDG